MDAHAALKRYFNYDSFLDNQEQVVQDILTGSDWCVIMPTGAGKSLCYQLPILMRPGYGIIVSPLISLMKDQVDALNARNIPAGYINSTVSFSDQILTLDAVRQGDLKLLYVAPERFHLHSFRQLLEDTPPSMMVIDEAHCISQWGHDFRPSYLAIGPVIEEFNIPQVCAFTATATPRVREDICEQLHRPDMQLAVAGFKRPNLAFRVIDCPTAEAKKREVRKLLEHRQPTIIYVSTRKLVDELSAEFDCIGYHAGLSDEARTEAQEHFMMDPCPVLVATNAFGMGIDRPDVRRVIHYTITGSLEAYYQEAGRAGRDGEAAECVLLFSYSDRFVQEFLIDMSNPPREVIEATWRILRQLSAIRQDNMLEVTLSHLVEMIPDAKNDTQLSSVMRILEKAGYVARGGKAEGYGQLRFLEPAAAIIEQLGARVTQRSLLVSRSFEHFGAALQQGVAVSYDQLARVAGLNVDQVRRVLRALEGEWLEWTPPFAGSVTEILRPDDAEPELDFAALERKRDFDDSRLEEVLAYTRTPHCRQRYLVEYFGEAAGKWQCDSCDRCHGQSEWREAEEHEREIVRVVLDTVAGFRGRLGRSKISLVLAGGKRAEMVTSGLIHHPSFGRLDFLKQNEVMQLLRSLEAQALVEPTLDSEFPCLEITQEGQRWRRNPSDLRLNVPVLGSPAPVRRAPRTRAAQPPAPEETAETAGGGSHPDLLEALKSLRTQLAKERGVPAYIIFSDATLEQLAEAAPASTAEAMRLKGIGPAKAATILPQFLSRIREWRDEVTNSQPAR